ncbi:hypothetical protein BTJ40_16430 [Microbulbifer sp. A4B17]|uniref:hypothetical protein n=1 Tax=Microbulbifer sp. A4B17 TaxID=359370 RepID=UPI000D52E4BF|nr:hypothetical protein [Microbulbifer sp. A4B17]AWF82285.1 hypothetical protein BTJ40_16430 [Microbulbifer sp. A4B17]
MNNLDKLGKIIAQDLRDSSLERYLALESGSLKSPSTQELIKELDGFSDEQKAVIRKVLTNCIDSGVHNLLFAIEEEKEDIAVLIDNENVAELSDGLNGEIYTEDGWFEKFSQYGENGI